MGRQLKAGYYRNTIVAGTQVLPVVSTGTQDGWKWWPAHLAPDECFEPEPKPEPKKAFEAGDWVTPTEGQQQGRVGVISMKEGSVYTVVFNSGLAPYFYCADLLESRQPQVGDRVWETLCDSFITIESINPADPYAYHYLAKTPGGGNGAWSLEQLRPASFASKQPARDEDIVERVEEFVRANWVFIDPNFRPKAIAKKLLVLIRQEVGRANADGKD